MRNSFKFIILALSLMLFCTTVGSAANVTADFSANTTSGFQPLSVSFTDLSTNATSWEWDVGDGTANYTTQNVIHTYNSPGTYTVTLTASGLNESATEAKTDYITVQSLVVPNADFSANSTSGQVPLSVSFTDLSTDATSWEWNVGDGTANYTTQNVIHTYTSIGTYTVSLTAINANGTDTETKTSYIAVSGDLPSAEFSADVTSGQVPLAVNFTDLSTDVTSWEWDVGDGTANYTTQNVTHTYSSAGTYTVSLTAINANGTDTETKTNYVNVQAPLIPVAAFSMNETEGSIPFSVAFTDDSTYATSWEWNVGDGTANYTTQDVSHTYSSTGTFNITLTVSNPNGTDSITKSVTAQPKTYFSGDRIWDENAGQSTDYTWNAKSFSGFFYDLESGLSSETMTITDIDRSIGDKDIVYETRPVESDFEHSGWGKYEVIGFMAEKYFAAYTSNTTIDGVDIISMMSDGQLAKVLIDDDEKESVFSGSSLILEEGYELKIVEVDVNGNSVFVRLVKDGDELDSDVVSGGDDYIYQVDVGDSDDVVLIAVHFDNIFSGTESNAVFVEGIFQISDEYTQVESGDSFGKMEVTSVGDTMIQMKNDDSVSLSKGKIIDIMGKIKLIVADDNDLRFAPFVDMSEPGTYELRGTVAEGSDLLTWTPLNFEGFYYDIDEGIQTEQLQLLSISGRSISDDQLVYTSTPKAVEFEHSSWNSFNVIGFQAEKYFAGYPATAFDRGESVDMLSDGQLSKVILDEDEKRSVYSGSSLTLGEGYTLDIVEVDSDGDQVLVELKKDGDEIDTDIVSANDDYIYEEDLGDSDDVPIIAVHFDEVFRGSESNAVFVEGIFQISDEYKELETGDTFGEMEITSLGGSIVMKNEDSISLSKDKDIEIMDNVGIRVADSDTVRYYPYTEVTTSPDEELKVTIEDSVALKGEEFTITVTSRGASVAEATVEVEGTKIGETDDEGRIDYTPNEVGTLEIVAEKEGYVSGTDEIEVIDPDDETKKISIEVSPEEVFEGSPMTIYVLMSIGGDAIQGADVTFDGKSLGSTSSDGTITYTPTEPGMHKLVATKSGLLDAELDIKVEELAAKFEFSNLVITPVGVTQGKEATFTVDVENTGTAAGDYTVELKVNGTVVGSQTISMEVGGTQSLEFQHAEEEPGTYIATVGGLEQAYEVVEKSGVVLYALGAIVLAAAGAVGYLFTAGGWTVEIAQAKVGEAIEAIKELVANYR